MHLRQSLIEPFDQNIQKMFTATCGRPPRYHARMPPPSPSAAGPVRPLVLCLSAGWGGLEIHVRDYCRWLVRTGVDLRIGLHPGGRLRESLADLADRSLFMRPSQPKLPLITAGPLARFIDAQQIDLVHSHCHQDLPLATLARWRSARRPACVHTQHIIRPKNLKRDPYHRLIYGALAGYIGVSRALTADAETRLPLRPGVVRLVHPGVPPAAPAPRRQSGPVTVGVVGTVWMGKGHHLALEAAERLRRRGIPVRVALSGRIDQQDYFERLQAYAREHSLDFEYRGVVTTDEAFAGVDLLAMCSTSEPFGMVTVEAMRRGVPVAGTDIAGTADIIRHEVDGLLFPVGDAQALGACIERLSADPQLRDRLCASALQRAAQEFDADTQFGRLWETTCDLRRIEAQPR